MGDFFKGWRPKAGLVTLVMALVLTGTWLRSYVIADTMTVWDTTIVSVISANGVVFVRLIADIPMDDGREYEWESEDASKFWMRGYLGEVDYWSGGSLLVGVYSPLTNKRGVVFSHSLIVVPLTLLSAWLILGKRRNAKPAADSRLAGRDESSQ